MCDIEIETHAANKKLKILKIQIFISNILLYIFNIIIIKQIDNYIYLYYIYNTNNTYNTHIIYLHK